MPEVPLCDQPVNFFPDYASGPAAVVATDGAIWTMTGEGLVRYVDDVGQFITAGDVGQSITVGARGCVAFPGPDSGVWLRSDPGFVLATPQGAGSPVPLPRDSGCPGRGSWAAGPDGTVLVSTPSEDQVSDDGHKCYMLRSSLRLWDGSSWRSIDPPDPTVPVWGVLVTDDGAAWAISGDTLSRYDDQQWTTIDPDIGNTSPRPGAARTALAFRAAPAGEACVLSETDSATSRGRISCYDSAGQIAR